MTTINENQKSSWQTRTLPDKVRTGQVWLIVSQQLKEIGTVIIVVREDGRRLLVVPAHKNKRIRRGIDVVLDKEHIGFNDTLVVLVDSATWISHKAFENSLFLGVLGLDGLNAVLEGINKQQKIASKLSVVQYLDMMGEDTKSATQKAFRSGVMALSPVYGRYEKFDEIFSKIYENLLLASIGVNPLKE